MATRDLPDIYALAQERGYVYIRQIPSGHGISNIYVPLQYTHYKVA